jgi:hypothetical protein
MARRVDFPQIGIMMMMMMMMTYNDDDDDDDDVDDWQDFVHVLVTRCDANPKYRWLVESIFHGLALVASEDEKAINAVDDVVNKVGDKDDDDDDDDDYHIDDDDDAGDRCSR